MQDYNVYGIEYIICYRTIEDMIHNQTTRLKDMVLKRAKGVIENFNPIGGQVIIDTDDGLTIIPFSVIMYMLPVRKVEENND